MMRNVTAIMKSIITTEKSVHADIIITKENVRADTIITTRVAKLRNTA